MLGLLNLSSEDVRLPMDKVTEKTKKEVQKSPKVCKSALMKATKNIGIKIVCNNRKARFNYFFQELLETGYSFERIQVKSLRDGKGNITDSYATDNNGEIYLINSHIPLYKGLAITITTPEI